jgi:two-component system, NtrC family, nitrogen regulation response regulator GlnG
VLATRDLEEIIGEALHAQLPTLIDHERGRLHRAVIARLERPLLAAVLAAAGGNQLEAARILGINRNTLRKRLRLLGLAEPRVSSAPRA